MVTRTRREKTPPGAVLLVIPRTGVRGAGRALPRYRKRGDTITTWKRVLLPVSIPPARITLATLAAIGKPRGSRSRCSRTMIFATAGVLQAAGVLMLLVGDSAANTMLGLSTTRDIPPEFLVTITAVCCASAGGVPAGGYAVSQHGRHCHGGAAGRSDLSWRPGAMR